MLLPHIPRHPARYLGTRTEAGDPVSLGRLAAPGDVTLWLDEGGIHFQRPGELGPFLLPRRCLQRAEVRRRVLRAVVDIYWIGAGSEVWVSTFAARRPDRWPEAVQGLREATEAWEREARSMSRAPEN